MDNALRYRAVDSGYGSGEKLFSCSLVARVNGFKEFLDLRLKSRLDCFVLHGLLFDNQDSFFSGFNIRDNVLLA